MKALLRFVPAFDPRVASDPALGRVNMLDRGGIGTLTSGQTIPVVVNHDPENVIGRVLELHVLDCLDGTIIRPWWHASVELDDPVPEWLQRGCGVSWSYAPLQMQDVNGSRRIVRAIIDEISILSPGVEAGDRLARVETLSESVGPRIVRRGIGQCSGVR